MKFKNVLIFLAIIIILIMSIYVFNYKPYQSGDNIGYNLGLFGGLGMLSLLLYSLRKRLKKLEWSGKMTTWFKYHILIGILSPILILFHTNFELRSMNSSVAFYSMLIVFFSGIIGRFIYRHTLIKMNNLITNIEDVKKIINVKDENILNEIENFQKYSTLTYNSKIQSIVHFLTLKMKGNFLIFSLRKKLKLYYFNLLKNKEKEVLNMYLHDKNLVNDYILNTVKVSQLKKWEKLFSLWHFAHIPFLYLLFLTAVIHVIAVHIY